MTKIKYVPFKNMETEDFLLRKLRDKLEFERHIFLCRSIPLYKIRKRGLGMSTKFTDLHCKEVICVCDGRRLGFIADARIDLPEGHILAIIVPGPCRFFGLWGRKDDYVIPWHCIKKMGPDIVLVDIKPDECRVPRGKSGFLFG